MPPPGWWPHGDDEVGTAGDEQGPTAAWRDLTEDAEEPEARKAVHAAGPTGVHMPKRIPAGKVPVFGIPEVDKGVPQPQGRSNRQGGERRPSQGAVARTSCRKPDGAWRGGALDVACCGARWKGRPARLLGLVRSVQTTSRIAEASSPEKTSCSTTTPVKANSSDKVLVAMASAWPIGGSTASVFLESFWRRHLEP